jgi:HlyD family secretion protein
MKSPGKLLAGLIIVALGLAGFGIFLALRSPASKNATSSPASPTADRSTSVTALGRLEPGGEVFCLAAPSSSTGFNSVVRKWMVKEGDRVQKNQVVAVLDTYDRLYTNALQAQAQVREAQVRVNQAQTGAKTAEIGAQQSQVEAKQAEVNSRLAELQNAESEYQRYERLAKDGAISASDLDRRRLTLNTAGAAARQAVKELEQARRTQIGLAQVRPVDVQQAQAELQVAIANLQRAKADLETSATRSPIVGQVLKVYVKEGEQIGSGQLGNTTNKGCNGIAEIGKTDQMYAVAEVDETSIAKVRPGQRAKITSISNAFPGDITGTVEHIGLQIRKNDVLNTDPVADTDARVVEVKVRLDDSKPVATLTNSKVSVRIVSQ